MTSINDTFLLQSLMFRLLHKVITDPQRCFAVISVFEQIKFRTEIGQMLDLNTVDQETRKLNYKWIWVYPFTTRFFNSEYYMEIITNKTAYYTIFLPIYLGLVLCDCDISTLQSPLLKEICTVLAYRCLKNTETINWRETIKNAENAI